jgi:deoxyadenosine/deoxycytidine kinase
MPICTTGRSISRYTSSATAPSNTWTWRPTRERIHKRARDIETSISPDYLALLDNLYDEWMASFDLCPVLKIRTDDLDFVHQKKHLDLVVRRIQDRLTGQEEMVF